MKKKIIASALIFMGGCFLTSNIKAEEATSVQVSTVESSTTNSSITTNSSDTTESSTTTSTDQMMTDIKDENIRVIVTKQAPLYKEESLKTKVTTTTIDHVYKASKSGMVNGKKYYYITRKTTSGWVEASAVKHFTKTAIKEAQFTGIKEYNYYSEFDWTKKGTIKVGTTYKSNGYYTLGNGTKYYSIYREDNTGKTSWYGYVNANALRQLKKTNKTELMTGVKEYSRYSNFFWKSKGKISVGTTYKSTGYYTLGNGTKYYSISREDSNGKSSWYGYVNANALRPLKKTNKTELMTGVKEYNRYSNFFWKQRGKTSVGTTYKSTGYYTLGNGTKYYSISREDSNGKSSWYGYVNANALRPLTMKKQPAVMKVKKEYNRYSNFFWKYRGKASVGTTYQTKGYYTLGNGSKYYSLYNSAGDWQGYVNANALKEAGHEAFYFSQKDERWNQYYVRNTSSTMYDIGCAPTSLAMALNIMHDDTNYTNPWKVADVMARVGVLTDYGTDASYNVLPNALSSIGLNARYLSSNSSSTIKKALAGDHMVLLNGMGSNPFTSYGHYILASDLSSSGKVFILDPWKESNNGWWNISDLQNAGLWRCFEIWKK